MSHWFRFYDTALDNPKVQRLSPHLFKVWVNVMCLASQGEDGVLPGIDDIAWRLRLSSEDARTHMDDLIMAGLVDIGPDKKLRPHDWSERQFQSDTSAARTRKWRQRKKETPSDGDGDAVVTSRVTVGDAEGDGIDPDPDQIRIDSDSDPDPRERERVEVKTDFVGSGRGGSVSVEARRRVCAKLAIADAGPLVAIYEAWPPSRAARDPDALFISQAAGFYRDAAPEVRQACQPCGVPAAPPEPPPPVRASPALLAKLNQGKRHAVRAN